MEWCDLLQRLAVILMAITEVKLALVSFPLNTVVLFFWCLYKHTKGKCFPFLSWNKNVFVVCYYRDPFFSFKLKQIWKYFPCPLPPTYQWFKMQPNGPHQVGENQLLVFVAFKTLHFLEVWFRMMECSWCIFLAPPPPRPPV